MQLTHMQKTITLKENWKEKRGGGKEKTKQIW